MWNEPSARELAKLPKLYANEDAGVSLPEVIIHMHFFIGGCDWYIAEYDGENLFFGYANLGDDLNAEWGYISLEELREIKVSVPLLKDEKHIGSIPAEVDRDLHWRPKPFREIKTNR